MVAKPQTRRQRRGSLPGRPPVHDDLDPRCFGEVASARLVESSALSSWPSLDSRLAGQRSRPQRRAAACRARAPRRSDPLTRSAPSQLTADQRPVDQRAPAGAGADWTGARLTASQLSIHQRTPRPQQPPWRDRPPCLRIGRSHDQPVDFRGDPGLSEPSRGSAMLADMAASNSSRRRPANPPPSTWSGTPASRPPARISPPSAKRCASSLSPRNGSTSTRGGGGGGRSC